MLNQVFYLFANIDVIDPFLFTTDMLFRIPVLYIYVIASVRDLIGIYSQISIYSKKVSHL